MALLTGPGPFQVLISDSGPVQDPVGSGWDAFWEGALAGALAALIGETIEASNCITGGNRYCPNWCYCRRSYGFIIKRIN